MYHLVRISLVAQMVKSLPAIQETQVRSLGQEDPLEKRVTTHSSIHAWEIPQTDEPGGLRPMGSIRVRHDWATHTHTHTHNVVNIHADGGISVEYLFLVLA